MGGRHELRHVLPGWFEGSLRYLELYSEVMKRGPWNIEGRAVGPARWTRAQGRLVAVVALQCSE